MTRSPLLCLLLAAAGASVGAADTPPFTGNWTIHNIVAGNESEMACAFTQKDTDLTGACQSDQGEVSITGKIDDKKINWIYKSQYNGGPITLTYEGKLGDTAGKFAGTVKVEEYGVEGEFTATLSK